MTRFIVDEISKICIKKTWCNVCLGTQDEIKSFSNVCVVLICIKTRVTGKGTTRKMSNIFTSSDIFLFVYHL